MIRFDPLPLGLHLYWTFSRLPFSVRGFTPAFPLFFPVPPLKLFLDIARETQTGLTMILFLFPRCFSHICMLLPNSSNSTVLHCLLVYFGIGPLHWRYWNSQKRRPACVVGGHHAVDRRYCYLVLHFTFFILIFLRTVCPYP